MRKYATPILLLFCLTSTAQTFTATTGLPATIPSSQDIPSCYNLNVSGVGSIGTTKGLSQVCLTINHTSVQELEILLQAPDGTYVPLSIQNGGTGDNYTSTCFSSTSNNPIKFNSAPFTGTFLPEGHLGAVNNGQNADGIWKLCILDGAGSAVGSLREWSITFNNNPAPAPPSFPNCAITIPSSSDCANATSICDFNGICGNTPQPSLPATKKSWADLDAKSCFGIQNNSFIKFIASSSTVSFSVWVPQSQTGFNNRTGGIQMLFFSTPTCGGLVTTHGCYDRIYPYNSNGKELINLIYATNLTPGNTYYLVIDGRNGDQCNFRIAANSGINILNISASSQNICLGDSVTLTASGGNGIYSWAANNSNAGLAATSGTVVKAGPTTSGTIRYSLTSTTGFCPTATSIDINISAQPTAPVVTATQPSCTTPTGTITVTAITGSTYSIDGGSYQTSNIFSGLTPGNYNVRVKNAGGCVSPPTAITINSVPTGTPTLVYSIIDPTCSNSTGGIVIQQPVGSNYEYNVNGGTYQNSPSISNLTSGNYTITVRDKLTGCVSPASPFTIKTAPVAPIAPTTSVTQPTCTIPTGSVSITNPTGPNIEYSLNEGPYQAAPSFVNLNPGNYTIKVKDNTNGCESNVTTFTINAAAAAPNAPTLNPVTQPTCSVSTGSITINSPTGSNIEYSLNGGNYQSSPTFNNLASGSYTVTSRSTPGNCVSPPSVFTINPAPAIPSTPVLTITVKATCSNQQGTITITNPSGNNLSYGIDGAYQTSPIFPGLSTGRAYIFTVKNTSSECVSGSSSLSIDPAICNDDLFVPNAFTPNGDGKNDILFVRATSIRQLQFFIFNQWGEKIFESTSLSNGWDGTYKGKKQPVGVYVYVLKAVSTDGKTLERKGSVTIIR